MSTYDVKRKVPDNLIPFDKGHARLINLEELSVGAGETLFGVKRDGIWCGSQYFPTAPFRLDYLGNLIATSANLTGDINATGGTISGNLTVTGSLLAGNPAASNVTFGLNGLDFYYGTGHKGNISYDHGTNSIYFSSNSTVPFFFTNDTFIDGTLGSSGDLSSGGNIAAVGSVAASGNLYSTGGGVFSYGNIITSNGSIQAHNDIVSTNGQLQVRNDILTTNGSITSYNDISANNGKYRCRGNNGTDFSGLGYITSIRANGGNLQAKYREITMVGGIVVNVSSESGWQNMGGY